MRKAFFHVPGLLMDCTAMFAAGTLIILSLSQFACTHRPNRLTSKQAVVAALRQNDLYKKFIGFSIIPRDPGSDYYLFYREIPPRISYYLGYDKRGPHYMQINESDRNDALDTLRAFAPESFVSLNEKYLDSAYVLIHAMRSLNIRAVSACYGFFDCILDDSLSLRYLPGHAGVGKTFLGDDRYFWVDSNFICYNRWHWVRDAGSSPESSKTTSPNLPKKDARH